MIRRVDINRALLVAGLTFVFSACGNGPTSPGGPGTPAGGNWAGTWQLTVAGAVVSDEVTANLTQNGSNVSGTWSSKGGASGQISFVSGSTIAGTLTVSQTLLSGVTCSASTSLTGSATSTSITFTFANIPTSGLCQWGENGQFSLSKQ